MTRTRHGIYRIAIIGLIVAFILYAGLAVGSRFYKEYLEYTFYAGDPSDAQIAVWDYAQENGFSYSDYPQSLIELLERTEEARQFVLEYPLYRGQTQSIDLSAYDNTNSVPLFLQWDQQWGYLPYGSDVVGITGCGPVCLSMVAYYLTGDISMSPDRIVRFAEENGYYFPGEGTTWTLFSEGAVRLGFDVTQIPLNKNRILVNLELGNPIVCVVGPGDFTSSGHFIVLSGCEDGMIRVNDPNSPSNSEKLWSFEQLQGQILNLWVIRNLPEE